MLYSKENPWIREREATICIWKVDQNRGYISNMNTSLFSDFMSYSARQIGEYVKMMKACGFTGIQVTDMCSAWRSAGSWECVHDKFRILADELHKNGMKFTVWCWAAEFTAHGWHDEEVRYASSDPEKGAYEDPAVLKSLNKYYDIYAELAPYADRVIAHFFDPGEIRDVPSIIKAALLLFDKFRAKNPNVKIGIDTWGSPDTFPQELVDAGLKDVMLMELPFLPIWRKEGKRASFRKGVKALGCELGSWGWYTCEMEIDQLPMMFVNNRVIADVYKNTIEQGDSVMTPSYWSEMDSYHVINFFSMYAAGHLLTNPYADPDELLRESAELVVGEKYADKFTEILALIRDARSGDKWTSYWWTDSPSVYETADRGEILRRADLAVSSLEELIAADDLKTSVSLPITGKQLLRLMLPHLMQIKKYARFCVEFDEIKRGDKSDRVLLQKKVDALEFEIPEYNCVIGLFGQPEARRAYDAVRSFCTENGLVIPDRKAQKFEMKHRLYERLCVKQRGQDYQVFSNPDFYECAAFGWEYNGELIDELVKEGVFVKNDEGRVALTNWENFRYDFNI